MPGDGDEGQAAPFSTHPLAHSHAVPYLHRRLLAVPVVLPADLCTVKDEKHLQRPQKGQWAVQLAPLPAKLPLPDKKPQQQQQQAAAQGQQQQREAPVSAGVEVEVAAEPGAEQRVQQQ